MWRTASLKFCERIATKESDRSVGDSCVCGGPILGIRNKNIYYTVCNNLFLVFVCCKCQRSVQLLIPIWSSSEMLFLLALSFMDPGLAPQRTNPILIMKFQKKDGCPRGFGHTDRPQFIKVSD